MRPYLKWAAVLTCIICAGVNLYHGKEGWGWFLFVAVLLA